MSGDAAAPSPPPPPSSPPRPGRLRRALTFAAVALAAAIATLVVTADRLPRLDREGLAEARQRWQEAALGGYRLTLVMEGTELSRGSYRVTVAGGQPVEVLREGQPVTGDPSFYTVDGLLRLLDQELDLRERPAALGAASGYQVYLFARFDRRGVPVRFRRLIGGSSRHAEWRVTGLEPR